MPLEAGQHLGGDVDRSNSSDTRGERESNQPCSCSEVDDDIIRLRLRPSTDDFSKSDERRRFRNLFPGVDGIIPVVRIVHPMA